MTKTQRIFLLVLLILPLVNTHAEIFSCKDSAGRLITSDRVMPECADKTTRVYTNSGVLKEKLSDALTAEEKRAAELKEQQRAQEAREQEQQRKEQRYLTAHYPTENDIELARKKELKALEAKIAAEQQTIAEATQALNSNHRALTRLSKNQQEQLMHALAKEDDFKQTIRQSNSLIQRYNAEKVNINRRFDATYQRYIELIGSSEK